MKVFLAGATGAMGKRLVPLLIAAGHEVTGLTKTPAKAGLLRAAGAEPMVADALDRYAIHDAVMQARPDVVVHQLTALANMRNLKNFDDEMALTNRLRTEGAENLLAAAQEAGAKRFVAQSYTGWPNDRRGGRLKTEDDALDPNPPKAMKHTLDAIERLERMVAGSGALTGIVLRYGSFYGPGTSLGEGGDVLDLVRHRRFPIFGEGAGIWSFIHIDDAANATKAAIEQGPAGIYNIVDDDPAEVAVWLPELARELGAKPPMHLPVWVGRLMIGDAGIVMMNQARGSSNEKAKRLLGWRAMHSSWRDGFRSGLSDDAAKSLPAGRAPYARGSSGRPV